MPKIHNLEIVKNELLQTGYSRLTLAGSVKAEPGQFMQIQASETYDPLLRRPVSVHDCTEDRLVLLFRQAGRGTALLAKKKAGEYLNLIGPLGSGFPHGNRREAVLVAGGIGAAPLYYLLRRLHASGKRVSFYYGARTKSELLLRDQYKGLTGSYTEATDDGSAGYHGLVTEPAGRAIAELNADVYACGPSPMLREIARLCKEYDRQCFVSLEAHMACGVGACLGCVIPVVSGGYKRVCVDGPVFKAQEVFEK